MRSVERLTLEVLSRCGKVSMDFSLGPMGSIQKAIGSLSRTFRLESGRGACWWRTHALGNIQNSKWILETKLRENWESPRVWELRKFDDFVATDWFLRIGRKLSRETFVLDRLDTMFTKKRNTSFSRTTPTGNIFSLPGNNKTGNRA
jgi:hypothetical protein